MEHDRLRRGPVGRRRRHPRRRRRTRTPPGGRDRAAIGAAAGPVAWNAILRATHADTFFTDAPVAIMPASWQDTGSGVFAIAATAVLLGLGLGGRPARRTVSYALLAGLAAFLVEAIGSLKNSDVSLFGRYTIEGLGAE